MSNNIQTKVKNHIATLISMREELKEHSGEDFLFNKDYGPSEASGVHNKILEEIPKLVRLYQDLGGKL